MSCMQSVLLVNHLDEGVGRLSRLLAGHHPAEDWGTQPEAGGNHWGGWVGCTCVELVGVGGAAGMRAGLHQCWETLSSFVSWGSFASEVEAAFASYNVAIWTNSSKRADNFHLFFLIINYNLYVAWINYFNYWVILLICQLFRIINLNNLFILTF